MSKNEISIVQFYSIQKRTFLSLSESDIALLGVSWWELALSKLSVGLGGLLISKLS